MEKTLNGFRVFSKVEDDTLPNKLVESLKKMLAEAYILYHTIHGFHWNVSGDNFYEYHKFFDEIVSDIYDSIDPIAENIKKLGGDAPFTMGQMLELSRLKEVKVNNYSHEKLASAFLDLNEEYIENIKECFKVANESDEQGIADFISGRISEHQKWSWFLKASIGG